MARKSQRKSGTTRARRKNIFRLPSCTAMARAPKSDVCHSSSASARMRFLQKTVCGEGWAGFAGGDIFTVRGQHQVGYDSRKMLSELLLRLWRAWLTLRSRWSCTVSSLCDVHSAIHCRYTLPASNTAPQATGTHRASELTVVQITYVSLATIPHELP